EGAGRHREGTGLGLAITRRLVEAMDGKLDVQSRVGEGSTFTVELDLETASEGEGAFQVAPQIIGYEGRRRRVVVADDDGDTRRLIIRMLGGLGFDIGEAPGANEALAMARTELPDLIITDLSMPGVTGLELAQRIRGDEMLRAVPLLAISASASNFTRDEALAAGCNGFVAKPLRAEELLESIRGLLGLTWRTAERAAPGPEARVRERLESLEVDGQFTSELYDLAMKGDVKELLSRAKAAVEKDPAGGPLYDEVRRLARQFDMKGVRRALQRANEAKR
ncbi:MAG: ATP-binding response regulator, partial [Steroidobacteraceae bacterium]